MLVYKHGEGGKGSMFEAPGTYDFLIEKAKSVIVDHFILTVKVTLDDLVKEFFCPNCKEVHKIYLTLLSLIVLPVQVINDDNVGPIVQHIELGMEALKQRNYEGMHDQGDLTEYVTWLIHMMPNDKMTDEERRAKAKEEFIRVLGLDEVDKDGDHHENFDIDRTIWN